MTPTQQELTESWELLRSVYELGDMELLEDLAECHARMGGMSVKQVLSAVRAA